MHDPARTLVTRCALMHNLPMISNVHHQETGKQDEAGLGMLAHACSLTSERIFVIDLQALAGIWTTCV